MAELNSENLFASQQAFVDRDELVERYRPYVFSIVKQVKNSLPLNVDFEELVSYGMIGLLEAADRYDPRRKVSFSTFSYYRIKGAVFDGLREMGFLTRTPNPAWVRREAILNDLIQTATDDETDNPTATVEDEIANIERSVDSLIPAYLLSLSDENAPEIADKSDLADVVIEQSQTMGKVRSAVKELPEKEREIIESLYFKHISTKELAQQMGVNKSWVSRLHSKAVQRLRQRLSLSGVISN